VSAVRCRHCDLLVGLPGVHVLDVHLVAERLEVTVESDPGPVGCPDCGVVGVGHGRVVVRLVDVPSFGTAEDLVDGSGVVFQAACAGV